MPIQPVVYMETNRPNGTIYTGMTADLTRRHAQHLNGTGSKFAKKYNINRLVWFEVHPTIASAIARENQLKDWRRAFKIALILKTNPEWNDLSHMLQDLPRQR